MALSPRNRLLEGIFAVILLPRISEPIHWAAIRLSPVELFGPETWETEVKYFMSNFKICKICIVTTGSAGADELLQLSHWYVAHQDAAISIQLDTHRYYRLPPSHPKVADKWRHTNCIAKIYTESFTRSEKFNEISEQIRVKEENPSFIIMLLKSERTHPHPYGRLLGLASASTTAAYLVIRNGKFVDMLCVPCLAVPVSGSESHRSVHIHKMITSLPMNDYMTRELQGLTHMFTGINANLQGGCIVDSFIRPATDCDTFTDGTFTPPWFCAILAMERKLNFSTISYDQVFAKDADFSIVGFMYASDIIASTMVTELLSAGQFEWATAGETWYRYSTVNVVEIQTINISALCQCLDGLTWTFTILSSLFVAGALTVVSRRQYYRYSASLATVLSFLIDHSILSESFLRRVTLKSGLVIFLWAQVAMVISNGYRSAIFSLLTFPSPPSMPESMEELAERPELVFSNEVISGYYTTGYYSESMLHWGIQEYIKVTSGTPSNLQRHAEKLGNKLRFVNGTLADITFSLAPNGQTGNLVQDGGKNASFHLPSSHIFIGKETNAMIYRLLLNAVGKNLIVMKGMEVELMRQRFPFLIYRNFILHHFTRSLLYITESGLWDKWSHYDITYEYIVQRNMLKSLAARANPTEALINLRDANVMAALFADSGNNRSFQHNAGIVSIKELRTVFLLFGITMVISLVQCLREKCRRLYLPSRCSSWHCVRLIFTEVLD